MFEIIESNFLDFFLHEHYFDWRWKFNILIYVKYYIIMFATFKS